MKHALLPLAPCALLLAAACGPAHIDKYTPRHRDYEPAAADAAETRPVSPGSLWQEGQTASMLFGDQRALRVNDLVMVKIEEIADAKRSSDTDLSRRAQMAADVSAFLSYAGQPLLQPVDGKLGAGSEQTFEGKGSTARTERLTATVSALVRKVLPNGNLFIEGHRVVLVNNEEQHFYISGVVRPIDIDQQNSISSAKVADAEIEFTGRGVLTDNQRVGWLARVWGWIWPF